MARLVLINGMPGSGKSTLACRYADVHPLTLVLDIDVVRAMLGRWLDHPTEAGLIARGMAVEMARLQLTAGRDVLVPQFLSRVEFIIELEQLCQQVGAEFVELALLSSPQDATTASYNAPASPRPPPTVTLRRCGNAAAGLVSCRRCTADCWRSWRADRAPEPW